MKKIYILLLYGFNLIISSKRLSMSLQISKRSINKKSCKAIELL